SSNRNISHVVKRTRAAIKHSVRRSRLEGCYRVDLPSAKKRLSHAFPTLQIRDVVVDVYQQAVSMVCVRRAPRPFRVPLATNRVDAGLSRSAIKDVDLF